MLDDGAYAPIKYWFTMVTHEFTGGNLEPSYDGVLETGLSEADFADVELMLVTYGESYATGSGGGDDELLVSDLRPGDSEDDLEELFYEQDCSSDANSEPAPERPPTDPAADVHTGDDTDRHLPTDAPADTPPPPRDPPHTVEGGNDVPREPLTPADYADVEPSELETALVSTRYRLAIKELFVRLNPFAYPSDGQSSGGGSHFLEIESNTPNGLFEGTISHNGTLIFNQFATGSNGEVIETNGRFYYDTARTVRFDGSDDAEITAFVREEAGQTSAHDLSIQVHQRTDELAEWHQLEAETGLIPPDRRAGLAEFEDYILPILEQAIPTPPSYEDIVAITDMKLRNIKKPSHNEAVQAGNELTVAVQSRLVEQEYVSVLAGGTATHSFDVQAGPTATQRAGTITVRIAQEIDDSGSITPVLELDRWHTLPGQTMFPAMDGPVQYHQYMRFELANQPGKQGELQLIRGQRLTNGQAEQRPIFDFNDGKPQPVDREVARILQRYMHYQADEPVPPAGA